MAVLNIGQEKRKSPSASRYFKTGILLRQGQAVSTLLSDGESY